MAKLYKGRELIKLINEKKLKENTLLQTPNCRQIKFAKNRLIMRIDGRPQIIGKDNIDTDTRGGCIAYCIKFKKTRILFRV